VRDALYGTWLEDGTATAEAGRWRFLDDGTFSFARRQGGVQSSRRGSFDLEERNGRPVLKLLEDEKASLIPLRLGQDRVEMLVRSAGETIVRSYHRANTQVASLAATVRVIVGRWERADTRHDEMIGEFYEFAADGTFVRIEGCHRNLTGDQTTSFEQMSVRSGVYLLEQVPEGVLLSFDLDGQVRPAGLVRLSDNELTLDGPRPLRLLRRVVGPAFRRQQEAR